MDNFEFRSEGKKYPMLTRTEFWRIGDPLADNVGHTTYKEFFSFVMRNLNLPHDYSVLSIIPDTLREIKAAHLVNGDFEDRKQELRLIEEDVEKLLNEFEASYTPAGFFGNEMNEWVAAADAVRGFQKEPDQSSRKELLEHGTDITALAESGAIDDCIGRESEIWAMTLTLARRKKANPVLVGPAGVGKSQLVYGLAHRIARKEAGFLNNWCIIEMSSTGLVAGTKYVGELEKKMKGIIDAVKKTPNVILFIDEIHTIMGTGKGEKSTLDIANILKPVLASGELKLIGATTDEEYHILVKDPAVERRFNKITVKEPTFDEATEVIKGIQAKYEKFHGVKYYKNAIEAMVNIAKRYNPKRNLPDSAVDILDYCGALGKVNGETKITLKKVKEFTKKLYNLDEKEVVNTGPLTKRETTKTIGFI